MHSDGGCKGEGFSGRRWRTRAVHPVDNKCYVPAACGRSHNHGCISVEIQVEALLEVLQVLISQFGEQPVTVRSFT